MFSLLLLLFAIAGCGIGGPSAANDFEARQLEQGPFTIGVWLPAGLDQFRFDAADQDRLLALRVNQVEWLQRATVGESTAEELAMDFCSRNGLSMPVYYEPKGFSPYEKLRNWTTRAKIGLSFAHDVRERVRALNQQWLDESGFSGYLIGHEDYRASFYPALRHTVEVLAQEDSRHPAYTVGRLASFPEKSRFLDAFLNEAGPTNVFQQEHYIFRSNLPERGNKQRKKLRELVEEYDGVSRHLHGRNGRWHAILQAHGEDRVVDGETERFYRKPNPAELAVQAGAALSRGASGIIYFLYSSGIEKVRNKNGEVVQTRYYRGIVDGNGEPTSTYEAIRQLNAQLSRIGQKVAPLYFRGGYSARSLPPGGPVETAGENDLELGFFGDSTATTHLLVVNMRTAESRDLSLTMSAEQLRDAVGGEEMANQDGSFRVRMEPAEIRLFEVN